MRLTELIERGYLKKALDILEEHSKGFDADISKDILLLKSRLTRYLQKKARKTESENTLDIELNQLFESVYDLTLEFENQYGEIDIPELDEQDTNTEFYESEVRPKKSTLVFDTLGCLIGFVVVCAFVFMLYSISPFSQHGYAKLENNKITEPIKHIQQIGFDNSLKQLHISIDILDQKFTWQKNEITIGQYIYDGRIINLREYFKDQLYLDKINESIEIICLGNASFEERLAIPVERRKSEEETRALVRARNLRDIIKSLLVKIETPVYILNLGKHKFQKPPSSNLQRSIIIIRVLEKETGVNVNQALYDALIKSTDMPFKITDFSLIENDSVQLSIK